MPIIAMIDECDGAAMASVILTPMSMGDDVDGSNAAMTVKTSSPR